MSVEAVPAREVVVLRVGDVADGVTRELARRGRTAAAVPVGEVRDVPDDVVAAAVGELISYRWVACTSAHAARRLGALATPWPTTVRVAAVAEATASVVRAVVGRCDAFAPDGTAASLASVLDAGPVLFLAAATAREDLPSGLRARGIEVTTVVCYGVEPRRLGPADATLVARAHVLVAMSPRAIDALCELDATGRATAASTPLVVLGPTTERHAVARGFTVACQADGRDPASVADAVDAVLAT
jgi:uroporphyrinogen-III synthase